MADDSITSISEQLDTQPPPKREPLRVTVSPGNNMTPGPPSGQTLTSEPEAFRGPLRIAPKHAPQFPTVASDEDYATLPAGSEFVDPEGKRFTKPYTITPGEDEDEQYGKIPEGAKFIGSDGQPYTKPKFEGIGFSAEWAYNAVTSDNGRKQALEKFYPGKVKQDASGFYVDDNGVLRRPGVRGAGEALGKTAAEAPPLLGMTAGGVVGLPAGAIAGTAVEPGGGTVIGGGVGVYMGEVSGAMAGRQFNNVLLSLAGIHETPEEITSGLAWEGAGAGGGALVGKTLSGIVKAGSTSWNKIAGVVKGIQTWKEAVGTLGNALVSALEAAHLTPAQVRNFLGTTPEMAERSARVGEVTTEKDAAGKITKYGRSAPPSAYASQAPMLHMLEQFNLMFNKQDVFGEGARNYYEKAGSGLLANKDIGVFVEEPLTRATKGVSSRQAGQMAIEAARRDMAFVDAEMEGAWRQAKSYYDRMLGSAGGEAQVRADFKRAVDALRATLTREKEAASKLIQEVFKDIRRGVDHVLDTIKANENPGELGRMSGAQFSAAREAAQKRLRKLYNASDAAGGAVVIDTSPLFDDATEFLSRVPEIVRQKYPDDIRLIAKLAGKESEKEGEEAIEATHLTFKEMRMLRSWLRHGIDYNDLTPDMREGSLKLFAGKVNQLLHDPNATPELKEAASLLDIADAAYKKEIPFFNDETVRNVVKSLESGAPPDPQVIADYLLVPGRTEARRRARQLVGEGTWKYVQAADTQRMLKNSLTLEPGKIDGEKFAAQVEDRVKNGILSDAYDPAFAKKILQAALDVMRVKGAIPIKIEENDTIAGVMRRIVVASNEAENLAATDPLKALAGEVKRIDAAYDLRVKEAQETRRQDPLRFLYEDSQSKLFTESADKIINSKDLIVAAAAKFTRDSPEFRALQQVYAHRFFQRTLSRTPRMFEELGSDGGMTEEVQALIFPGITRGQMITIAEDMEFLFSGVTTDFGGSLAARSRMTNPWNHIAIPKPGWIQKMLQMPGMNLAGRKIYEKYLGMAMDAVSHPDFANWLASDLKKGSAEREVARAVVQNRLRLGGWLGAAAGQVGVQNAGEDQRDQALSSLNPVGTAQAAIRKDPAALVQRGRGLETDSPSAGGGTPPRGAEMIGGKTREELYEIEKRKPSNWASPAEQRRVRQENIKQGRDPETGELLETHGQFLKKMAKKYGEDTELNKWSAADRQHYFDLVDKTRDE